MKTIELQVPSENVGRDTLSRYDMQFQAAAFAALEILESKGVDCVYCDFHDDFVVRKNVSGHVVYHFFQVKTKKKLNHQWSLREILEIKQRGSKSDPDSLQRIKDSFGGKLILHSVVFGNACEGATLISNVHFGDDVVGIVAELREGLPQSAAAKILLGNFAEIFGLKPEDGGDAALDALRKLSLQPAVSHIGWDRSAFASAARSAIFRYSEIDLGFYETNEIAANLVNLVYAKSKAPLGNVSPEDMTEHVGVTLDDLLEVLSISRAAYEALISGEDPKALKTASVIQRWLKEAGGTDDMIEYASRQKVNWDVWLRTARHIYTPIDLQNIFQSIDELYGRWVKGGSTFALLASELDAIAVDNVTKKFVGLNKELLFGAITSVAVRRYSR